MNATLAAVLANCLAHVPDLVEELTAEFQTIAHGEGGLAKVNAAISGLASIAATVAAGAPAPAASASSGTQG